MKPFVLDCSISASWCLQDETNDKAESILQLLLQTEAYVPSIWPYEMANVLVMAERRNRMSKADAVRALALIQNLPIRIVDSTMADLERIQRTARDYQVSAYDAGYLELSLRFGIPMATLDNRLISAAQKVGVVLL